ncbi:MAG: hypothetical protein IIZ19_06960 [Clostridia bacterium]|nr:hypothetical protein [Clostridia bacterium]
MNKLRKQALLSILLVIAVVLPCFAGAAGTAVSNASFSVASKNAILVESATDTVIYQKNINDRIAPGELTKLMTAIIAVEYGMLDDIVTISETAAGGSNASGTVANLKVGEQLSVRQLLYCMILDNNDVAAVAIAEHIGGTEEDFARSMTEKAAFIGAQNTNFTNATGQHNAEQYSTVWDMYIIADYFMQSKLLMEIASTKSYTLPPSEWRAKKTKFYTNDHLISTYKTSGYYYRYADGLIGGQSNTSGSVVAAAASRGRGSMSLIFIGAGTSGDGSKYSLPAMRDAGNVFREAYSKYKIKTIVKKGEIMTEERLWDSLEKDYISLVSKDDVSTVIPQSKNEEEITVKLFPNERIMAPISAGDTLGTFEVYDNDVLIVTGTLTSEETIRANIILKLGYWISTFFSFIAVRIILIVILVLAVFYVFVLARNIKRNERRKEKKRANAARSGKRPPAGQPQGQKPPARRPPARMPRNTAAPPGRAKTSGGRTQGAPAPRAHNKTVKTTSPKTKAQKPAGAGKPKKNAAPTVNKKKNAPKRAPKKRTQTKGRAPNKKS